MDILVNVVLPLSLAIIMLSLGIGLTIADFGRVVERGWVFAIGALCQILLIPIVAYAIIVVFGITGELAAGVMLLSFCPGGVTTNAISRFARGDVALSVSLTAVVSILSIFTVPLLVAWSVDHFMGADAPEFSVVSLAVRMVLITTIPVALGMIIRALAPRFADGFEPILSKIAGALFVIIVLAAIIANWELLMANLVTLGPALAVLCVVTMLAGLGIATALGLSWAERKTISIEVGIQNGTLGITLAPVIVGSAAAIPAIGFPAAVYSVLMYVIGLPIATWLRSQDARS